MSTQLSRSPSQAGSACAESGYDSAGSNSIASLQTIYFTTPHLKFINAQLQELEPEGLLMAMACAVGQSANFEISDPKLVPHHAVDKVECFFEVVQRIQENEVHRFARCYF